MNKNLNMIIEYLDRELLPEMERLRDSAQSIRYRTASINFYNNIDILKDNMEDMLKEGESKEKFVESKNKFHSLQKDFIKVYKRYDGEIGQSEDIWRKANIMFND